jgi:hypothetical protein
VALTDGGFRRYPRVADHPNPNKLSFPLFRLEDGEVIGMGNKHPPEEP